MVASGPAPQARVFLSVLLLLSLVTALTIIDSVPVREASAAFPGSNGKIAFISNRDGNFEIYSMDADGDNQVNLSNHPADEFSTTWSPDGTKIAFTSWRDGNSEIYVMTADGGDQINLTSNASLDDVPVWSPDGTKIAFSSIRDGNREIHVMDADGSNQVNLTNHPQFDYYPAWSPDGTKIAFSSGRELNGIQIYVMDADGSNQIRITSVSDTVDTFPNWSPDGSKIAFVSRRDDDDDYHIYVMNADGSNQIRLSDTTSANLHPVWSPDGNTIAFTSNRDGNDEIYSMNADGSNPVNITNSASDDLFPAWQPLPECALLVVPGIAGTYAADPNNDLIWLINRGTHLDQMRVDPLGRVYDDLIVTLENVGYSEGEDLFVVNYDWRLPPAPFDGAIDGQITGLSGNSITNTTFAHSVDYLGYYLRQAVEAHEQDDPDARLECVDIIAHSTGGLVTRSYIQSSAYQDSFTSANGECDLPRVNEFIMLGVPNRGASKAWNPLNDNWAIDPDYRLILSKIVYRAWLKVVDWNVHINGPDYAITRASIDDGNGNPDPMKFIRQYVPTIGSLLATYDFLDSGAGFEDVNSDPDWRNSLLLDLNDGFDLQATADPSPFASLSTVTAIYGTDQPTATTVIERTGPSGTGVIAPFTSFTASDAVAGPVWYQDIQPIVSGDGTVPIDSAAGQFFGDDRVSLIPLSSATTSGSTGHTGLVGNPDVQATILDILGRAFEPGDISTGSGANIPAALSVIFDPVEGFVIDGLGRRLGYSLATGPLMEMPGSAWFGTTDGFGIVTEPLALPLTLSLTGLGENYVVHVTFEYEGQQGGITAAGYLGHGETLAQPVELVSQGESSHFQACLFAGSLSQVSDIGANTESTNACGRGTAIKLLAGEDLFACLFAGSLSHAGYSEPTCSRGEPVGFAGGTDYYGCLYAGSLSRVGTSQPSSCGRGVHVGFSGEVVR